MAEAESPNYLDRVREGEKNHQYNVGSSLIKYKDRLRGIDGFLGYVQRYLASKTVLDIGAGSALAINELAQSREAKGLTFLATGLVAETNEHTGINDVPYLVTAADTLEGIADASIGGILAHYSITYTDQPGDVVRAIERVLVPGGIIKTALHDYPQFHFDIMSGVRVQTPGDYAPHFRARGFDVATHEHLLYAIKPGLQTGKTAESLMGLDAALHEPSSTPHLRTRRLR